MCEKFNPERLKYARVKNGLTITDLSELLNISSRTLSKYENDHEIPNLSLIAMF